MSGFLIPQSLTARFSSPICSRSGGDDRGPVPHVNAARRSVLPDRLSSVAALCVVLLAPHAARAQSAPVPPIDASDRTEVVDLYRRYYLPDAHALPGWTGSIGNGAPGTLNRDFVRATLRRINYYRAMTGLPGNVVFDPALNARCQQTALMMSAQHAISHSPARGWKFYTPVAADTAAHANLDLDHRGTMGPGSIDRYISDFGSENGCVGHRRWLLYNAASVMGTGAIPAAGADHPGANVTFIGGPAPRRADAPPSAAWPPAGFVPAPLVYDRWSFSYDAADFHAARVRVTKNGAEVPALREKVRFQVNADGYGSIVGNNTVVWTLPGNVVSHTADETYRVQIDNVYVAGVRRQFDYTVTSIDPTGRRREAAVAAPPAGLR